MWELWMLQQNSKEKTWAAPLWRSIHIYQKGSLPQAHPVRYPPSGSSSPSYTRRNPCHNNFYLYTKFRSRLIRGLNGQILIKGDFNGHSYSWGNLSNDTRGDVIERFTEKNSLCILNNGSPTYLKPQAQHSQNPTSAIDLSICTPGGEPTKVKCNYIWANVITFVQM